MFWVYLGCSLALLTAVPCVIMVRCPGSRQRVYGISKTITAASGFLLILAIIGIVRLYGLFLDLIEENTIVQGVLVLLAIFLASLITTALGFWYEDQARREEMKRRWKY